MSQRTTVWRRSLLVAGMIAVLPVPAAAADPEIEALRRTVETLRQELEQVKAQLRTRDMQPAAPAAGAEPVTRAELDELQKQVRSAAEWKESDSLLHIGGYADVGYTDSENADGSFNVGTFAPIFHFQYRDLVMLESELELGVEPDGETEVTLEYLTTDLFLNDYVTLVGGKFLSPIGQFRQNLHPSWINKLPSAPPGFGHDGAAPLAEVGLQARGGFGLGPAMANYAFYVGNGPELEASDEGGEVELEGIDAEGFGADRDGEKVAGGRFGLLPLPGLEVGLSGATGKIRVTSQSGDTALGVTELGAEPSRDYDVYGFDFAWQSGRLDARGELVRTEIGNAPGSVAPAGADWQTWYVQGAYRLAPSRWELVLRYTDFDSPHASEDQRQWAVGTNYLFANSVIGKLAYEANRAGSGSDGGAGADRWLVQFAYGF